MTSKMILLDTNTFSYVFKGHTLADAYKPDFIGNTLAISFMTVAELFEGAYRANWHKDRRLAALEREMRKYVVIPFSPNLCRAWGRLRTERKSQPISVDDAWIAATALAHNIPLATHNAKDFGGIAGLQIITH